MLNRDNFNNFETTTVEKLIEFYKNYDGWQYDKLYFDVSIDEIKSWLIDDITPERVVNLDAVLRHVKGRKTATVARICKDGRVQLYPLL